MYIHILIIFAVLFIAFCLISKKDWLQSLFFTVCFILILWINLPCFIDLSALNGTDSNFMMLPFQFHSQLDILYVAIANAVLAFLLCWQASFSNKRLYTHREVKKSYDRFGEDAVVLYVIGKDLDFLYNKKYKKQTDRIIHLGNKCKLLCEPTNNEELLNLYRNVRKEGVEIRFYRKSDNMTNLKGQIKVDQNGSKKAIFMSRKDKKYLLLNIENQFLVASIEERFLDIYEKSCTEL